MLVIYARRRSQTLRATSLLIEWTSLNAAGVLVMAGNKWHSANPPALIGAKGVSRWPVLCCTVGRL